MISLWSWDSGGESSCGTKNRNGSFSFDTNSVVMVDWKSTLWRKYKFTRRSTKMSRSQQCWTAGCHEDPVIAACLYVPPENQATKIGWHDINWHGAATNISPKGLDGKIKWDGYEKGYHIIEVIKWFFLKATPGAKFCQMILKKISIQMNWIYTPDISFKFSILIYLKRAHYIIRQSSKTIRQSSKTISLFFQTGLKSMQNFVRIRT